MVDIPGDHCITVEEPPDKKKICKCCKCSKSKVLHKPKPASDPSRHRPCLCTNKKMSKCRCGLKDCTYFYFNFDFFNNLYFGF